MTTDQYAYIWEYLVAPDADRQFRHYYGPEGAWVQLFRRAPGYLFTRLYQDHRRANRYVTVDAWESEQAFREFHAHFADEFARLDSVCEALTLQETPLGEFRPVER